MAKSQIDTFDNETQNLSSRFKCKSEFRPRSLKSSMLNRILKIWANILIILS